MSTFPILEACTSCCNHQSFCLRRRKQDFDVSGNKQLQAFVQRLCNACQAYFSSCSPQKQCETTRSEAATDVPEDVQLLPGLACQIEEPQAFLQPF